jgi:hypothetical protein
MRRELFQCGNAHHSSPRQDLTLRDSRRPVAFRSLEENFESALHELPERARLDWFCAALAIGFSFSSELTTGSRHATQH